MADSNKRDGVFVSYSHLDSEWLDRVRAVLDPDVRNGRIQYFDDRELGPGDPWYKEITDAIDHAKIAVLLVSPNFFASRFIAEDELPRILRAVDDGLTILWVPLSGEFYGPDTIPGSEKLTDRQAVWDASQTLDSLSEQSRTAKLLDLCRRINAYMVTRVADARNTLAEAWTLETDGPDVTGSRIVFLRLTAALIERESAGVYVGLLKTLLAVDPLPNQADVQETWDIDYFIPNIRLRIEDGADFLESVIAAMNDRSKRLALDAYSHWSSQPALPARYALAARYKGDQGVRLNS